MHIYNSLILIISFITLTVIRLPAQQTVLTSGGDFNGVGGSLSFSVGQIDYTNFISAAGGISLGVQQPLVINMVGTEESEAKFRMSVFPNPANTAFTLKLEEISSTMRSENPYCRLYDINGKLLLQKEIKDIMTVVSMAEFGSGMYLLRVAQNNSEIKAFKIFKTN